MKFEFRHRFPCSVEELERVLFHEKLFPLLRERMETIMDVEPLSVQRTGPTLRRRIRYLPKPIIKSVGVKKVDPQWMEWVEESEYDFTRHKGTFKNIPTNYRIAAVMKNVGTLELRALSPNECEQVIVGDLAVNVFLVGKVAEKVIAANAGKILDDEARVVADVIRKREI